MASKTPEWIPKPTQGKEQTTGFIPVDSSWIAGIKYTPQAGVTMTTKKGGRDYNYPGFGVKELRRWISAQSKGKWWWRNVGHVQLSRWTGPVHPLYQMHDVDQMPNVHRLSRVTYNDAMKWLREKVSPHMSHAHFGALIGALPGTRTDLNFEDDGNSLNASTFDENHNYIANRVFRTSDIFGGEREPYMYNDLLTIQPGSHPYRGTSAPGLLRQARAAYELGIPHIHFQAGWRPPAYENDPEALSGGLHWPLMGVEGRLPSYYTKKMPQQLKDQLSSHYGEDFDANPLMSKVMQHPTAREYYMDNPVAHNAWVDTTPGSYSRKAIERHVNDQAARHGMQPAHTEEMMAKQPLHLSKQITYKRYTKHHPWIEHLYETGSLHPDHSDEFFEN